MKNNDVILSYPFSGAFYAFLCDSLGAGHTDSQSIYYKSLFGKDYQSMSDMSLTLAIIYDNIVIPGVDIPLPDASNAVSNDGSYYHKDLGIKSYPAEAYNEFPHYAESRSIMRLDLEDNVINRILGKVPRDARWMIVNQAHDEIQTAIITRSRVLCHPGRAVLIKRLIELDYTNQAVDTERQIVIDTIRTYKNIFGLSFSPGNLDELYDIKSDREIRKYANQFVNVLHAFDHSEDPKSQLAKAMSTAMNTAKVADKVSGVFSFASSAMGVAGLVPIVGTVTGAMGIASDVLTRSAESLQERNEWYQLAPRIIEKKSERLIHDFINENRVLRGG